MGGPMNLGTEFTVVDCFAGAGGLSLGLRSAGFTIGAAFDADPIAARTYSRNIGPHNKVAKAEEITGAELCEGLSHVSLVAGGPPCQGFSRQRRGADHDDRNALVSEFLRIVLEIRPVLFLMENVSSIQAKRGEALLSAMKEQAERNGYAIQMRVLNAANFGVPQHRRRMFIVGELEDTGEHFKFPEAICSPSCYRTVRDAIGDLPSPFTDPDDAKLFANHEPDNISELNRIRISHVPAGGGRADIPPELQLPCHRVSVDVAGHRGVYGRLSWDEPAGTITTKCNSFTRGRFAHPEENRNITMRETARLQGFPDNFVFEGGKVDVAHQIGNAVPPPLASALGCSLITALRAKLNGPRPSLRPKQMLFAL